MGGPVGEGQDGKQNVENILDFNALSYQQLPDLSVATKRTTKYARFANTSFVSTSPSSSICVLNTGSDYINGRNCFLEFNTYLPQVTQQAQTQRWTFTDSAVNFVRSIRITDKSGNELEYIENVNMLSAMQQRIYSSTDELKNEATLYRIPDTTKQPGGTQQVDPWNGARGDKSLSVKWIIPLRLISGLFNHDQLLPPQLMSSLRVEIQWENRDRVVMWEKAPDGADFYALWDLKISLDTYEVTDSVARQINIRSATDGLEIQYKTYFTSVYTIGPDTQEFNVESRRQVSRAYGALLHTRPTNSANYQDAFNPSMATDSWEYTNWQWRAGNLFFPQVPNRVITNIAYTENSKVAFRELQEYAGKQTYNNQKSMAINSTDFVTGPSVLRTQSTELYTRGGMAPGCVSFEKSTVQDITGIPLNNSRTLEYHGEIIPNANYSRDVTVYLQYQKLARVFMENLELEE